jgi:hypothetical protein
MVDIDPNMVDTFSPPISLNSNEILMDFPNALRELISGKQITRVLWNDSTEYGVLVDGWLTIHTKGEFHRWTVNDGDLLADDWKVVS